MVPEPHLPNLNFGELLRSYRVQAGLTQAELAEQTGLSVRGISDLERGARARPQRATLQRLLQALAADREQRQAFLAAARPPTNRAVRPATAHPSASHPIAATGRDVPRMPGSLIGRESELASLRTMVHDAAVRLITLTGPGGAGKTRLALSLAHDAGVQALFPGGIVFVDLSPVTDADLVMPRIATACHVTPSPYEVLASSLGRRFGAPRTLLVLDNCEQVSDVGQDLAALLVAAPSLTLLATSRQAFAVRAEQVVPVPPLPLPPRPDSSLDEITNAPAVALFVARARASDPDFRLTADNAGAIAAICRRLDGLPLALELAAARVPFLSVQELSRQLAASLTLLGVGPRDLPPRQRTLRDTIAWSYDVLDAEHQRLFRWLGVFAGSFSLDGLSAVQGDTVRGSFHPSLGTPTPRHPDTGDQLAALVAHNLVYRIDAGHGQSRYALLETIREFAADRLAEDPEADAVHAALVAYLHDMAVDMALHDRGGDFDARLQHIAREEANVAAALSWAIVHDPAAAFRLADALGAYWALLGRPAEGRDLLGQVLQAGDGVDALAHARVLCQGAWLAISLGEFDRATDCTRQAEALVSRWPGSREDGVCRLVRGTIAHARGNVTVAAALLQEALGIFADRSDTWGAFACHGAIGMLALEQGDASAAAGHYQRTMVILDSHQGSRQDRAAVSSNLAVVYRYLGERLEGYTHAARALALTHPDDVTPHRAASLQILGRLELDDGDITAAAGALGQSLRVWRQIGDRWSIATALETVAALPASTGDARLAVRLLAAAAVLRLDMDAPTAGCAAKERDATIASLRTTLGEKAFRRAWAEGEVWSATTALSAAIAMTEGVIPLTLASAADSGAHLG